MSGIELLQKSVKRYIGSDHITDDEFIQITRGISKDFNKLYLAYQAKESDYVGSKIKIEIDWKNSTVNVKMKEDDDVKQLEQEVQAFYVASEEVTIDGDGFVNSGTA